jgi:UDPglucose--hexose-1-phosphate uridylyltransferase
VTERRRNALTGDWVLVSPGRLARPWSGEVVPPPQSAPAWTADCYLCPRAARANGRTNPDYRGVFTFDNDFPALGASTAADNARGGLMQVESVGGRCRVLCYSERHDLSLGTLPSDGIAAVIDAWQRETATLGRDHAWVQVFENRGAMMGASSPHPHGQIWATTHVPTLAAREDERQRDHMAAHRRALLLDYAEQEIAEATRVVLRTSQWLIVVPYWAAWPFETLLIPIVACSSLTTLSDEAADDLVPTLARLLTGYDRLFASPFPYSMGWHGTPGTPADHWQLHAHFYPPLLRSASVRKHMVGYELLAETQRDLSPEEAAARLRTVVGAMPAP